MQQSPFFQHISKLIFLLSLLAVGCPSGGSQHGYGNSLEEIHAAGLKFYQEGNNLEAIRALNYAIEENPDFFPAHYDLGRAFYKQGDPVNAEKEYLIALKLNPQFIECYLVLGNLYYEQSRFEEAETTGLKVIDLKPDLIEPYILVGNSQSQLKRYEDAEKTYRDAIGRHNKHLESRLLLAELLNKTNKTKEALFQLNKIIELDPSNTKSYRTLGIIYYNGKIYDKALEMFKHVLELGSDDAEIQLLVGETYFHRGQTELARFAFEKSLALEPTPAANVGLAKVNIDNNYLDRANRFLESAIALNPEYADAYYWRGLTKQLQEKLNQAEADFRKAFELSDGATEYTLSLAEFLARKNDRPQAISILEKSLATHPDVEQTRRLVIEYLEADGNEKETIPHLLFLVNQNTRDSEVLFKLSSRALSYPTAHNMNNTEIIEHAENAYELTQSNDIDCLILLIDAYAADGQLQKAREIIDAALQEHPKNKILKSKKNSLK